VTDWIAAASNCISACDAARRGKRKASCGEKLRGQ